MPATGAEWCAKLRLGEYDPFNPEQNVAIGAAYLQTLLDKYDSEALALAAYNWGPENVDKYVLGLDQWSDWEEASMLVPAETRKYVDRVLQRARLRNFIGGRNPSCDGIAAVAVDKYFANHPEMVGGESMMDWLKKILIGKYVGRLATVGLGALGGFLVAKGLDKAVVDNWIQATQQLGSDAIPIIIALVLDQLQHKAALATPPPPA
jgi:hypothetical protein